jgi:transposase
MGKLVVVAHVGQERLEQQRRTPEPGCDVWIGVDVARSKWVYKVRWDGQEQRKLSTPGELVHLQALVEEYRACKVHVVYEACGFGYEIAWWCQEKGIDVLVVAPSTVEHAPGSRVKTDRLDAGKLARDREQGRLKGVRIPTRTQHAQRQLSRTYAQALKDKQRTQARVRSLMQEQGRIGPPPQAGWNAYLRWCKRQQQQLPATVSQCLEELFHLREAALATVKRLRAALHKLSAESQYASVVKGLKAQAGVGTFTALRLVLELGDIRRFPTAGSFPRYLGLTPSEYSTGASERRGHVMKCGPRFIRAWLIQCAWASIRPGRDPRLRAVFERLSPKLGKKRAIVAVARRLALRLRARWLEALASDELAPA